MPHEALLDAFSAALASSPEGDEEVDQLQELLRTEPAHVVATEVTGLTPDDPAFAAVLKRITIHHRSEERRVGKEFQYRVLVSRYAKMRMGSQRGVARRK